LESLDNDDPFGFEVPAYLSRHPLTPALSQREREDLLVKRSRHFGSPVSIPDFPSVHNRNGEKSSTASR
jgi:hypothetical protein